MKAHILLSVALLLVSCVTEDPVADDYFAGLDKIKGGQAPSAVELWYDSSESMFSWTASLDPETGIEVKQYFFYYAYGKLPKKLLDFDYYEITVGRERRLTINTHNLASGVHYFWVTGFDGSRQSKASNVVTLQK